jgi:hypothetical protein
MPEHDYAAIKEKFDRIGKNGFEDKYAESWCYKEAGKDKVQVLFNDGRSLDIDLSQAKGNLTTKFICRALAEGDEFKYDKGCLLNI